MTAIARNSKGQFTSSGMKALWRDSEFRQKVAKGKRAKKRKPLQQSPNQAEIKLQGILNQLYPKEWKFVGDWKLWIDGRNPDFVNVNGQKKVIELFGETFHPKSDEADRKQHYKKYGFDCLVIWSQELYRKPLRLVKAKIRRFTENGI